MDKKDIIERIKQIRYNAGLSARELSLRIGKNEAYISRLESVKDSFEPSISTLLDIIEVCNSSPIEFFYENINEFKQDKNIVDLLKKSKNDKIKNAVIQILENT